MAGIFDRFAKHYDRVQRERKRAAGVVSPDDPPVPDAPVQQARSTSDPGRNDPCPCRSGKKFKKCCGKGP